MHVLLQEGGENMKIDLDELCEIADDKELAVIMAVRKRLTRRPKKKGLLGFIRR
jgi:hypothetical protein